MKIRKVVVETLNEFGQYRLHVVGVNVLALVNIPLPVGVFQVLDAPNGLLKQFTQRHGSLLAHATLLRVGMWVRV